MRVGPANLPTVAPAPAPIEPSTTGSVVAAVAAAYPHSAVGRTLGFPPTPRSNRIAAGTIGTLATPRVVAEVALVEPAHDAAGRVEAEGAASGEDDRVHLLHVVDGIEEVRLPRPGRAAAHVHARHRARLGEDHGAAGRTLGQGEVADLDAGHGGQGQRCAKRTETGTAPGRDQERSRPSRPPRSPPAMVRFIGTSEAVLHAQLDDASVIRAGDLRRTSPSRSCRPAVRSAPG